MPHDLPPPYTLCVTKQEAFESCVQMDQAKNLVPCFTNRWPKDAERYIKHVLTLHVCGVLIHGEPDQRYLFPASQQLAGNSNLNIECMRRALLHVCLPIA